tara:strand:- start:12 stop:560 length:549 start_codon:yes stop_codon:yes gene_type:complete
MKVVKWILISLAALALVLYLAFQWMKYNTKKMSPEGSATFKFEQYDVKINYSRPSVKGRTIFGELVPYDEVWRTGANEATEFSTLTDLEIGGKTLPAGKYTLWTIPGPKEWQVIWNSQTGIWGVNWDQVANRDPQFDVLTTTVYKETTPNIIETLSINLVQAGEGLEMQLAWENALIRVPMK